MSYPTVVMVIRPHQKHSGNVQVEFILTKMVLVIKNKINGGIY